MHACAGKFACFIWKLYNAHAFKQSLSVETLVMSCMSKTEPPSAVLVLQRISKASDVWVICETSVMRGLLLAVYVEPLAAGQL